MTTAFISDRNSIYIPSSVSNKGNSLKVNINNNPPVWATNYRLVIKQAKKEYYNIFPIWFYTDGSYRYFRINESDRDKFAVGDYVIFKANGSGPTFLNTQYKILEFGLELSGFLGDDESAGLYFKIKVDDTADFNEDNLPNYGWTGSGGNDRALAPNRYTDDPIKGAFFIRGDKTIFYGEGDQNSLTTYLLPLNVNEYETNAATGLSHDKRYTIEIQNIDPVTYRWTDSLDLSYWLGSNIPISTVTVVTWQGYYSGMDLFIIDFDENAAYYKGDRWKINIRANEEKFPMAYPVFSNNAFPNPTNYNVIPANNINAGDAEDLENNLSGEGAIYGGFAVCNGGTQLKDSDGNEIDRPIGNGDIITIKIKQDSRNPNVNTELQEFFSPGNYENIEEWFIESGAYKQFIQNDSQGNDVGSIGICFRRANYYTTPGVNPFTYLYTGLSPNFDTYEIRKNFPVRMFIPGYPEDGSNSLNDNKNNVIEVEFSHKQAGAIVCETKAVEEDIEIYHEITDSYDVTNGLHKVGWDYADFTYSTDVFPNVPEGLGYTVLGPLNPNDPQPTDKPHSFSVGQSVYASGTSSVPTGYYNVLAVPNQYSIIVDLSWPGSAPSEPATVFKENWEQDQASNNNGAMIEINDVTSKNSQYNSFAFGNGVESYRIKDDFNEPEMKYSQRVTSIIEDYENERKEASLTYSGVFRGDTSINRLNEFNLSLANFKDLDRDFGPIEKLFSRERDIFVFQQDKINKVLYGKNILYDAIGGGQVASIPEVLGSEIPLPVKYGISNNPESFAANAGDIYFTDSRRGSVIAMQNGQVVEISSLGMTDYFRDELKDNPNKQKIGAYDPYSNRYTLSTENSRTVMPCQLLLRPSSNVVTSDSNGVSFFMFNISTQQQWAITLVDTGFGTGWVSPVISSGIGAANIYANIANNTTGSTRTINFVVTYCTSLTQIFTLTQSVSKPVVVRPIVINKPYKK